jgi:NACHT domain
MTTIESLLAGGLAATAVLLAIWVGKQFFGGVLRTLGQHSGTLLVAGRRTIGKRDLKRYRAATLDKDRRHPLGFLEVQIDVDNLYVPLKYDVGSTGADPDVYRRIRDELRTVVLGGAGAGKSMLLRHSLTRWARNPQEFTRVPVLIELHHYNDSTKKLPDLIISKFSRRGVTASTAERFVPNLLAKGRLCLMLDGLDEVVATRRDSIIADISDLAERSPRTQIIVTCRDAIYQHELSPTFDHEVRIGPLDDARIRRFLRLWFHYLPLSASEGMPPSEVEVRQQVDQLTSDLRHNPAIMRLAKNPLMLAMIASLETSDPGFGPSFSRSRADFYQRIIVHMLRRDKDAKRYGGITKYRAGHKQLALAAIAMAAQGGVKDRLDDRAIPELEALRIVSDTLTKLKMDAKDHSQQLLDEIVTRSELLIRVGESELIFPHLTLQEYLAAVYLADDPEKLLTLYFADTHRWRETVKLWCGIDKNASRVVERIFDGDARDKILSLECVAEAKRVEDDVADRTVNHFKEIVRLDDSLDPLVINGLGALVADGGVRGDEALRFLTALANKSGLGTASRDNAIRALAVSRTPSAAEVLVGLPEDDFVRDALVSIGEMAVPTLTQRAEAGALSAVDALASIATPSAAIGLAGLLSDQSRVARRSAWRLATLIRDPDTEDHLTEVAVSDLLRRERLDWVWAPFATSDSGELPVIMGRVAHLLETSDPSEVPKDLDEMDPRLALPLATIAIVQSGSYYAAKRGLEDDAAIGEWYRRHSSIKYHQQSTYFIGEDLKDASARNTPDSVITDLDILAHAVLNRLDPDGIHRTMLETLNPRLRIAAVSKLIDSAHALNTATWNRINESYSESKFFPRFTWAWTIFTAALLVVPGVVGAVLTVIGVWTWGPSWLAWIALIGSGLSIASIVIFLGGSTSARVEDVLLLSAAVIALLSVAYFSVLTVVLFSAVVHWAISIAVMVAAIALTLFLQIRLARRNRARENPLRHLLGLGNYARDRISVIAASQGAPYLIPAQGA